VTRVLGLDLSLTATGYSFNEEVTGVWHPKLRGPGRLVAIREHISILTYEADVVVLEGYSYASPNQAHQIGELGGVIRAWLFEHRLPFAVVPPASLKKFATGKGNAPKDAMLAAAIRRFGFEGSDNNEADAWLLRCMGLAHYDPWDALPEYAREALAKVEWPKLEIVEGVR
jgi:Holliday junction resolvasome RuvABC endonuclease subunit